MVTITNGRLCGAVDQKTWGHILTTQRSGFDGIQQFNLCIKTEDGTSDYMRCLAASPPCEQWVRAKR
jgi:hypothetical protein